MSAVYFELGTHCLQVVPRAYLVPEGNYKYVERVWGHVTFDLIDVGGNEGFMTTPCGRIIERGNTHVATLQWDDGFPYHLKYETGFWVGPLHRCIDPFPLVEKYGARLIVGVQMSRGSRCNHVTRSPMHNLVQQPLAHS